jgi:hypothetical protein
MERAQHACTTEVGQHMAGVLVLEHTVPAACPIRAQTVFSFP